MSEQIIYSGFASNEQQHNSSSLENDSSNEESNKNNIDDISGLDIKPGLTIKNVDWSIDVVLATNTMLQPAANGVPIVNLTLTLSDDSVVQRRLTTSELHKWRYTLARATKDLQVISSRQPPAEKATKKKK